MALEFWIWRERDGFILSNRGGQSLTLRDEPQAIEAAVRIAQEINALYRIIYARHILTRSRHSSSCSAARAVSAPPAE